MAQTPAPVLSENSAQTEAEAEQPSHQGQEVHGRWLPGCLELS